MIVVSFFFFFKKPTHGMVYMKHETQYYVGSLSFSKILWLNPPRVCVGCFEKEASNELIVRFKTTLIIMVHWNSIVCVCFRLCCIMFMNINFLNVLGLDRLVWKGKGQIPPLSFIIIICFLSLVVEFLWWRGWANR